MDVLTATEARRQAAVFRSAAEKLEAIADELEATDAPTEVLRGEQITGALANLTCVGRTYHFQDLLDLLRQAGYIPNGKDPANSLLAALSRSRYFSPVGGRSGMYTRR